MAHDLSDAPDSTLADDGILAEFHPLVAGWFVEKFGEPTDPQRLGWPAIAAGQNTLIAAPTGSGKTLSAFLVCIDRLFRRWLAGQLEDKTYVVYVSPLKALSNDIQRNLEAPLAELADRALEAGYGQLPVRSLVRTGDTPAAERQKMLRRPPHILVTTPESLYLLLTAQRSRELLRSVETVIVDEIHALVRDKRGSHLSLTLERLEEVVKHEPEELPLFRGDDVPAGPHRRLLRIGLSATQRPIEAMARFLVGSSAVDAEGVPDCKIVDCGHARELDLAIEVPPSELSAVCTHEQWAEVYSRLVELITAHRSTLVFVNTRRLAERVAHHLRELLGEEGVASHHGSLSREIRQSAEERLKNGQLRAIVATASLEMGIDIGYIDLVCQIGAPRAISTYLQRVGRAGHALGKIPKGRLFPLSRDELLECLALNRAVRRGRLDAIPIPEQPLDILAQQIIASVASQDTTEDELFAVCRRAWPYRDLKREDFDAIVQLASEGLVPTARRGAYLHRDQIHGTLRARRGARLAALSSGGAIPETALYRVIAEPEETFVGTVDEDFAIESLAGDVFLLGNTSWRILYVRGGEVRVRDAEGAPPSIPFWLGEAPGRTDEFSEELGHLRRDLAERVSDKLTERRDQIAWLAEDCGAPAWAAEQAINYVQAQLAAVGIVATTDEVLFERFFDESGGMQLVIHAPFGSRINRAWGLALRKRFCRSFDFELQAAATNDGIVLSMGPQHSMPLESLAKMLNADNVAYLLEQALLAVPMFQVRWRWNLSRALVVLRQQGGKRVPPYMQRFRSDDLLAAVFPETVGCLENHSGDVKIPDHPLVRQTMHDCLHEALDLDGLVGVLERVKQGQVRFVARDTREPSPFSYELINANPYAFLDGAALEERRVRAVATRRTVNAEDMADLARLDPQAIAQVRAEAWPLVRSADELHDALLQMIAIDEFESGPWSPWVEQLVAAGRATRVQRQDRVPLVIAAENWPILQAAFSEATAHPEIHLPKSLRRDVAKSDATVALVRGRIEHIGPTTVADLADYFGFQESTAAAALESLEGQGLVLRGAFTVDGQEGQQWCDRRLLARIHRLTLSGLRQQIQAVEPREFLDFLAKHHHLSGEMSWGGAVSVREAIAQLQGFELPAGAWESRILAARVADYDPAWLDDLFLSGEVVWGRLNRPRRDADDRPSAAVLSRVVPISLLLREELPTLITAERDAPPPLRSGAEQALDALASRGALFLSELRGLTQLLESHLEEALRELAAAGLVTCDSFSAVRKIAVRGKSSTGRLRRLSARSTPVGRWSLFPGTIVAVDRQRHLEAWCQQLLSRYGVVFRDLLAREASAPAWQELAPTLRRMELRGQVRGGRFISGVYGEQFGTERAVEQLRACRGQSSGDQPWIVISAADPVNLFGVVTQDARVPATHKNALVVRGGTVIATRIAGVAEFHVTVDAATAWEMRRAMTLGRRLPPDAEPGPLHGRPKRGKP